MNDPEDDDEDLEEPEEKKEKPQRAGGRQSMRNVNKTVKYHEDDYISSDEELRAKARPRKRKSKASIDEDFEESEGGKRKARARKGGGNRKKVSKDDDEDDAEDGDSKTPAKKGKLNRVDNDFESIDFSSDKTTSDGKLWNLKISSWNVGGLKAWIKVILLLNFSLK